MPRTLSHKSMLLLGTSVGALALICTPTSSQAETITTETYVQAKELPNVNEINFSEFDTNKDGAYSMPEVGERLFDAFDQDHNGSIDNREWAMKSVMTITPMEKETFSYIDMNDDGKADKTTYTYETFYQTSGLMKFDKNENGLSAEEFIGESFEKLDTNQDKLISKDEWKSAYLATLPPHVQNETYN